ncbi:hypothetical protein X943_002909 [Babesia divergens]|uniref:Uncharacterized protein n=1 Tax=Babesia divergens TaxID=32595 RepID=A0AAD9LF93_BABDI|nr:hypothetical protein X943_002909 [Babesia divergens]
MTAADRGGSQGRRTKLYDGSYHQNTMLPGLPMPSPELCLLNSRSPSCLYGVHHERSHRRRVRGSLLSDDAESSNIGIDSSVGGVDVDTPDDTVGLDVTEIRDDLRTYEALLSYIAVRLANKRNALEVLGIDMGSMSKGFGLLTRNATEGGTFLPVETLVKVLNARFGRRCSYASKTPFNLEGCLENADALRNDLTKLISHLLAVSTPEKAANHKLSDNGSCDKKRSLNFKDIAHLPLMDNKTLSLINPAAMVAPNDAESVRSLLSYVNDQSGVTSAKNANDGAEESSNSGYIQVDTIDGTERSYGADKINKGRERANSDDEKHHSQSNKCPRNTTANTHAKSTVYESSDYDRDNKDHGSLSSDEEKGHIREHNITGSTNFKESEMTEEEMLQNLMDGKLCDGSEPMEARDFVISILVAGLYEYLPVEFFNEILQDERLKRCFENIQQPDGIEEEHATDA